MAAGRFTAAIDAHCHLQLIKRDRDTVLRDAASAGIGAVMCCATHMDDWDAVEASALAGHDAGVRVAISFGLHPYRASGAPEGWQEALRARLEASPFAHVGECGLDKSRGGVERCPFGEQVAVFEQQVMLAKELGRVLSVHCVQAFGELLRVLTRHGPFPRGVVLHSWGGSPEMIPALVKLGCFLSFSGSITRIRFAKARASAIACPHERLLVETDSPDQLPVVADDKEREAECHCGGTQPSGAAEDKERDGHLSAATWQENEPQFVTEVLDTLAELRGESVEDLAPIIVCNYARLFDSD
jgi:TatD DNase family protein